jgi:DNA mismatch repair ATPase MutS
VVFKKVMLERWLRSLLGTLGQSADHIFSFFGMLRAELGFYVACLNLRGQLIASGEPVCFPDPLPADTRAFSCRGLYEPCLALASPARVVGNDVAADGKSLVIVTGANQGGKSTFLRSVGLAHLMMQCGMFVAAELFRASVCSALFTHFRREEDPSMRSGRLDEELSRMKRITDRVIPNALVLFNESFSATNELEGAQVANGIVRALVETGSRVFFVTHSYELSHRLYVDCSPAWLFLRAERNIDGTRSYRVVKGEPLRSSFGEDLYRRILGEETTT